MPDTGFKPFAPQKEVPGFESPLVYGSPDWGLVLWQGCAPAFPANFDVDVAHFSSVQCLVRCHSIFIFFVCFSEEIVSYVATESLCL